MVKIVLPRLPVNWQVQPQLFERYWDIVLTRIESILNTILEIPLIAAAVDAATTAAAAANSAAVTANSAAAASSAAALAAKRASDLSTSGVTGATITATAAGSDATATISTHTRMYGDGSSVSVTGGTLTGLSYSSLYYVYYDQVSRLGGSVVYQATTDPSGAAQLGDRHLVGSITTPAALDPPTSGRYVGVSGIGSIV